MNDDILNKNKFEIIKNLLEMKKLFGNHNRWINSFKKGYVWNPNGEPDGYKENCQERMSELLNFIKKYCSLPTNSILEIAVGYGRLTKLIYPLCKNFYGIDINDCCIDYCRNEFPNANFIKNDGVSIPIDINIKFDLVISYDSMVHFHKDVIELYINNIIKNITEKSILIFHHAASGKNIGRRSNVTKQDIIDISKKYNFKLIDQVLSYPLQNGKFNDCFSILKLNT